MKSVEIIFVVLFFIMTSPVWSAVINVPGDYPTIQEGIDAAVVGDTVEVASGTYSQSTGEQFPIVMKEGIVVRAAIKGTLPVVNASGSNANVLTCTDISKGSGTIIEGLHLTGGGRHPILDRRGGGIGLDNASPLITDCIIEGNEATHGGGIDCTGHADALIINCVIINNSCTSNGGGIHSYDYANPLVYNCTIEHNYAGLCGGGYFAAINSSPFIAHCEIVDNVAEGGGGGLHTGNRTETTVVNCLIAGNEAKGNNYDGGGGLRFLCASDVTIYHCTIANNQAAIGAGVACMSPGAHVTMFGCILWDNGAEEIADEFGVLTVRYSDIRNGYEGEGNFTEDPLFASGPQGAYYLQQTATGHPEDSPCLDAGPLLAEKYCFETSWSTFCFDQLTTRLDLIGDEDYVDLGYHYAAEDGSSDTAPFFVNLELSMPSEHFTEGMEFYVDLHASTVNYEPTVVNLFVLLNLHDEMWFFPSWTKYEEPEYRLDSKTITIQDDWLEIIPAFDWPAMEAPFTAAEIWCVVTDSELLNVVSEPQRITWTFGQ